MKMNIYILYTFISLLYLWKRKTQFLFTETCIFGAENGHGLYSYVLAVVFAFLCILYLCKTLHALRAYVGNRA